jgi:cell wall-associated NlpC family hydrolase
MRFTAFVLNLLKRIMATGMCCAFCTFAIAKEVEEFAMTYDDGAFIRHTDQTSDLAFLALSLAGIQYKFGGDTPHGGLDCSGLVRYVIKEVLGQELPRSSEEISHVGTVVENHDLQQGDLVFFNTLRRPFSHVGIYVGENKFIHSPATGGKVRIEDMTLRYWKQRFDGARRIAAWPNSIQ